MASNMETAVAVISMQSLKTFVQRLSARKDAFEGLTFTAAGVTQAEAEKLQAEFVKLVENCQEFAASAKTAQLVAAVGSGDQGAAMVAALAG